LSSERVKTKLVKCIRVLVRLNKLYSSYNIVVCH
jgi:hypothetical protein